MEQIEFEVRLKEAVNDLDIANKVIESLRRHPDCWCEGGTVHTETCITVKQYWDVVVNSKKEKNKNE